MIEDDLRGLLSDNMEAAVYARLIPLEMPESVTVQEIGGSAIDAGIRRTRHTISVMAVSGNQETAGQLMREARDILITNIPADIGGTHYYTATALADGSLFIKRLNGPKYVEYCDMEVEASI